MWHFTGFVLHYPEEEFGIWGPLCREAARISNFLSSPCQTADCEKIGQARSNFMLHRQHLNEVGKWCLATAIRRISYKKHSTSDR